ncbi:MAG: hypothetical protein EA405_08735 [Rhodospirillales bacterium]|nr:MAG: hypothetical protein EA405_08735 [Rhodospirillales bacterium]
MPETIALLRIEGVNFDASVTDTNDLSTVRGGSFLHLDAIKAVKAMLERCQASSPTSPIGTLKDVQTLSEGASIGLFRLTWTEPPLLQKVCATVAGWLDGRGQKDLKDAKLDTQHRRILARARFATFVVDIVQGTGEDAEAFITARENVIAANRWRQMQAPTLVPVKAERADGRSARDRVCSFDFVRPGSLKQEPIKGEVRSISRSVFLRRGYGLRRKFDLYAEVLKRAGTSLPDQRFDDYARNFEEIAGPGDKGFPLSGKIAVFYADGNAFSRIQDTAVRGDFEPDISGDPHECQRCYDERLRGWRDRLLAAVVDRLAACDVGVRPNGDDKRKCRLRLETLIWAGDDGTWVVPASFGWTLASTFFAETLGLDPDSGRPRADDGWRLRGSKGECQLHHAAGLVFCHHDAPITRIHRLARDLAEHAKKVDRGRSLLAYQVLESFDHIGRDLDGFRRSRCPAGMRPEEMLIDGATMAGVPEAMASLNPEMGPRMARRQVKRLALTLHERGAGGEAEALEKALLADLKADGLQDQVAALHRCFGDGPALWLHLDDLWDFLVPRKPTTAAGGSACAPTA